MLKLLKIREKVFYNSWIGGWTKSKTNIFSNFTSLKLSFALCHKNFTPPVPLDSSLVGHPNLHIIWASCWNRFYDLLFYFLIFQSNMHIIRGGRFSIFLPLYSQKSKIIRFPCVIAQKNPFTYWSQIGREIEKILKFD